MGNTVSAAEAIAAGIVHPVAETTDTKKPLHHGTQQLGTPPPECPMHQPETPVATTAKAECPLGHDKDVVNPLNMVIYMN